MPQLTWLITGCSSGFGLEFVPQVIARGDRVIATARSVDKIAALKHLGAKVMKLDVTSPQDVIECTMAEAINIHGQIDVLVNNAGFVTSGGWEDLRYEDILASFETNVFGPMKVTRALLPHFRQRKSGTIVFVSSLSGWIGHGFTGAYSSSKFALEGAVESLHHEISPLGIRTILMEPGRFRTPLLSEGQCRRTLSHLQDYAQASGAHDTALRQEDLAQPGDPRVFVEVTLDLVKQEGCATGREIPFRFPIGADSAHEISQKLKDTEKVIQDWYEVIHRTSFIDT